MSEHARLSFSASERWLRCAASVRMTEGLFESSVSAAAEEGTIAHKWLEKSLNNWIITGDDSIICDDPEMGEHLQKCMDYVIERYELMGEEDERWLMCETKVDLHYISNRDDLWGTADIILGNDSYIEVIDLKYGKGIFVEADTTQNRLYGLGAMCGWMKENPELEMPWITVSSTIMQPRYADKNGEIFRTIEHYPDDLLSWFEDDVLPIAKLTDRDGIEPTAGAKQCHWCLAKTTCPAAQKAVADLCSVFEPVAGTMEIDTTAMDSADIVHMDIDRLLAVHDQIPFIQGYLTAISKKIRDLLEARDPRLEGKIKLVRSRQTNQWSVTDAELIEAVTKGPGKVAKKLITRETVLSAPQALKIKALKPAQKKRIQEYIKKSDGSLTIVPYADERPNAFPSVVFEDQEISTGVPIPTTDFDFL